MALAAIKPNDLDGLKVLVCGGRDFADAVKLEQALDHINEQLGGGITMVIQGGARGADALAKAWALKRGIHVAQVDALWAHNGRAAGPIRNAAMLTLRPQLVICFPGGSGTASMKAMAQRAGLPVYEPCVVTHDEMMERLIEAGTEAAAEFPDDEEHFP